jgi:hypothetical protein
VVRDNLFRNIYCSRGKGLAQHAGFGLGPEGGLRKYPDLPAKGPEPIGHFGGVIRNNMIWSDIGTVFDTGIGLEQAAGVSVDHNTIFAAAGFSSIDVRYPASDTVVRNNLYNIRMTVRDGGRPRADRNVGEATADMFVDSTAGDLHLKGVVRGVVNGGLDLRREVPADIDGDLRDQDPDIGADEYRG